MPRTGFHRARPLTEAENEPPQQAKPRLCLRCQGPFESAWAGERVCPKCKTSTAWREGVAANMASWSR